MKLISSLIAAGFILLFTGAFVLADTPKPLTSPACNITLQQLEASSIGAPRFRFQGPEARTVAVTLLDLAKQSNVELPRELVDATLVHIYEAGGSAIIAFIKDDCVIGGVKVSWAVIQAVMAVMTADVNSPPVEEGTDAE